MQPPDLPVPSPLPPPPAPQILCGGENVYCTEVEAVLHAHPDVAQAAVFGMPNTVMGELVAAAVVLRHGANAAAAGGVSGTLVQWCRARLAHYKVPAQVHVVEALPATGSGKVQKTALRERFAAVAGAPAAVPVAAAVLSSSSAPAAVVAAGEVAARVAAALPTLRVQELAAAGGGAVDGDACHLLVLEGSGGAGQQVGPGAVGPAGGMHGCWSHAACLCPCMHMHTCCTLLCFWHAHSVDVRDHVPSV